MQQSKEEVNVDLKWRLDVCMNFLYGYTILVSTIIAIGQRNYSFRHFIAFLRNLLYFLYWSAQLFFEIYVFPSEVSGFAPHYTNLTSVVK